MFTSICWVKSQPPGKTVSSARPRHIINMMVELMQPTLKDSILDPAMGSAGFLLSSAAYISEHQKKELMKTENMALLQIRPVFRI